jgi:hypothetical protein
MPATAIISTKCSIIRLAATVSLMRTTWYHPLSATST